MVLLLALSSAHAEVWRQINVLTKHYLSLSGEVGYYSLLENMEDVRTRGGAGGALGLGYEMRYNNFWFGLGLDFQYGSSTMTTAGYNVDRELIDTQGKHVNFHYEVQSYTDTQHDFRIGLPILFGFYTNGIYGGAGIKFSLAPYTATTPTIHYRTTGGYEKYIDDFEDMPNHFYTEYTMKGRSVVEIRPQAHVIAELGYDILNKERMSAYALCSVLKVALYAEYGLNSCMKGTMHEADTYDVDPVNPTILNPRSYYANKDLRNARIVPLFVGIKVTFMLRIKTANCRCDGAI
jgi:hypothetical protein